MNPKIMNAQSELDHLITAATEAAEAQMRNCGNAGIVFAGITPETILVIPTLGVVEDNEKERFASFLRLTSIAQEVRACVISFECWFATLPPGELPTSGMRASNHPQRREGVYLSGEVLGGIHSHRFLPILRDMENGFTGFGPAQIFPPLHTIGRFSNLLPAQAPSRQQRRAAARMLSEWNRHVYPL